MHARQRRKVDQDVPSNFNMKTMKGRLSSETLLNIGELDRNVWDKGRGCAVRPVR